MTRVIHGSFNMARYEGVTKSAVLCDILASLARLGRNVICIQIDGPGRFKFTVDL